MFFLTLETGICVMLCLMLDALFILWYSMNRGKLADSLTGLKDNLKLIMWEMDFWLRMHSIIRYVLEREKDNSELN